MTRGSWFVTGSEGQLGSALRGQLEARGDLFHGRDLELDVADTAAVEAELARLAGGLPEVFVNAAALTHVDRCEQEPDLAKRVNAEAPAGLARLCKRLGIRFVHISTDYVFDGEAERPIAEDACPAPRSVYGQTKWQGEKLALVENPQSLILRTSAVFGRGRNFVAAVLDQAEKVAPEGGRLRVVDDQRCRPTWAEDLATAILFLVDADQSGIFHVTNDDEATWWDVARAALDLRGFEAVPIDRITTETLNLPAPRPRYSVLDCSKARAVGVPMRPWREALAAYLEGLDAPATCANGNA
ncbi:MAG: dTDP-4-dehydrorhamnose reductase [Deltaproteobacteria bacterium]|nr:dTDP-4-dehydrorhamnose reductase [Deltaproteobacteria bacterium]MBW2395604.1 dTDP-4-dehydrorhamnose reductase [Deltaproteobacteria bacterium]